MLCKSWQTTDLMMPCPIREEEAFVSQIRGIGIIEWVWLEETLQIIHFHGQRTPSTKQGCSWSHPT